METTGKPFAELSRLQDLASQLQKDTVCLSVDAIQDILGHLEAMNVTRNLLKKSRVKKALKRASKSFPKEHRLVERSEKLLKAWEEISTKAKQAKALRRSTRARSRVNYKELSVKEQEKVENAAPSVQEDAEEDGELSVPVYRKRLIVGRKELYKDPPVLPPMEVRVLDDRKPVPERDAATMEFHFPDYPHFRPNLSPKEV